MKNKIAVLLADDHAVVRAGIRQFLEQADDIEVIAEADDGEIAKQYIEQFHPDVAVLDIQMPKSSGIDVIRWSRRTHPEIGLLVLTAFDDDPYIVAVLQAGANGFVLKTAEPDEIILAVREVHKGNSTLDPKITKKIIAQITENKNQGLIEQLSERELEVLKLVSVGYTNKAIAVQLGISDRTVQGHLARIYNKLEASNRTEAVMKAVSLGLLNAELPGSADQSG